MVYIASKTHYSCIYNIQKTILKKFSREELNNLELISFQLTHYNSGLVTFCFVLQKQTFTCGQGLYYSLQLKIYVLIFFFRVQDLRDFSWH